MFPLKPSSIRSCSGQFAKKMAKISQREKVLLGYSPNFMSNLNSSRRSSEVDFSDVFGGPPRRSSNYEYYNYEVGGGSSFDSGDDFEGSRRSWFGLGEKPVFGEEMGTRRRYPSEDFFDDIFRGDQPLSRSQSPSRRDPFSSAPGSRVMSPSRSLPPMVEPFASPAKFSLPGRLTNPDIWASTSMNQTSNSASISSLRFNQTTQNYDLLHADTRLSYRPSPLSHHVLINGKESTSNRNIDGNVIGPASIKHSKGSEAHGDGTLFHFSIYKWPSKGVPLSMPLRKKSPSRSKERNKIERCLSVKEGASNILVTETHKVNISVIDSHLSDKSVLPAPSEMEDSENCKDTVGYLETAAEFQSLEDLNLQAPKSSYHHLQNIQEQVYDSASSCEKSLGADVDNSNSSRSPGSIRKFHRRPLGSFFQEEKKGRKRVSAKMGGKESLVEEKERPPPKHVLPSPRVDKSEVDSSFREAKDVQQRKEATGKVKDFVKMFNQEPSSNAVKNDVSQSQSRRWQGTSISEAAKEFKSTSTEMHDKTQTCNVNWSRTSWEASEVVDEKSFLPGKQQFDMNRGSVFDTPCPGPANDPLADGLRDSAPNIHATPENDMKSKEFLQDINIQSKDDDQTETRGYEVKILQWSKGKEGNIRALLSTLQHVLWPNSGWKPVPLVDIIEASAVKRAYQKALLYLHPDKLQQKGAALHQKFIAEKVFDTLQEAWDHFNSLGNF